MTKVRMLKSFPVSPTGLKTVWWKEGEIHEVTNDNIMAGLIEGEACELVEDKAEVPDLETGEPVVQPKVTRKGRRKS